MTPQKSTRIDVDKLRDPELCVTYQNELNTRLIESRTNKEHSVVSRKRISEACKESAKHILGLKEPDKGTSRSSIVLELPVKQKKLRDNRESTKNKHYKSNSKMRRMICLILS